MNEREVEKLVTDANDAWRPKQDAAPAAPTPGDAARADASAPDHVREQCPAGRHPVRNEWGGWSFVLDHADQRSDGATGETVQRFSNDGALRG
jgi:hypothetical protein